MSKRGKWVWDKRRLGMIRTYFVTENLYKEFEQEMGIKQSMKL